MARRKNEYLFAPQREKRSHLGAWLVVLALLAALAATVWLTNRGVNQKLSLETEKVHVMGLDKTFEGFTVLHISDLHGSGLADDLSQWKSLLNGKNYHAVVLSGDMVGRDGDDEPLLTLIHNLNTLREGVPIYFIAGDEDPEPVAVFPYAVASLPPEDQEALFRGIVIKNEEDLRYRLEDFLS